MGLLQYDYIQAKFFSGIDNDDFRDVFTNYYCIPQFGMRRSENRNHFFEKLFNCSKNQDLVDLVNYLQTNCPAGSYTFSFATKLLHTVNPDSPIFDRKSYRYLKREERVDLWSVISFTKDSQGKRVYKPGIIEHNWETLNSWYSSFLVSKRGKSWINWFDSNFPSHHSISNVKKIDLIISSCGGY